MTAPDQIPKPARRNQPDKVRGYLVAAQEGLRHARYFAYPDQATRLQRLIEAIEKEIL